MLANMKKMFFCLMLIFVLRVNTYAEDILNIDYKLADDKYVLVVSRGDEVIEYEKAVDDFLISEYMQINIDGDYHYFYLGEEISKIEYEDGLEINELYAKCDELGVKCIEVKSTDDVIENITYLYSSNDSNIYHLVYSSSNFINIDIDIINDFFERKIIGSYDKNLYKYDEYFLRSPDKTLPYHNDNMIVINNLKIKTNDDEITKVDAFMDVFLKEFDGKSDYEKIMGVYTYINNTAIYQTDSGYINFQDGQLSAYDVLIKHKAVCIGLATTFQLLMEKLGIDSYIVDHVSSKSDTEYVTTHTYNVVKLDGEWYIVDIALDGTLNGLLKGISGNYSLEDFKYYDIKIADDDYLNVHEYLNKDFSFDYAAYLDLTKRIDNNEVEVVGNTKEETEKSYMLEYILIVGILLIILGIIYVFTRKK